MKNSFLSYLVLAISLINIPAFSQTEDQAGEEETMLDLPGDNLDLFAVLDLFQKSPSIEEFEKTLNLEETGINNLDLNLDGKVDFIKVVTEQDGDDFTFVLQVDVSEEEIQDVAVILVSKDDDEKITMQVVGDKDLYGKDYVIEPAPPAPKVTANPAYTGPDPVTSTTDTTIIVVESAPIVQYVYSPVYVPYYPPYTYAYPPPYFRAFAVVAVGVYRHNNYYHYHGYHGGYRGGYHGNTVVVHNHNTYNNYNNSRHSSNTVNRNNANGNYNRNRSSASNRPSTTPSTGQSRASSGSANRAATPSTSQSRSSSGSANRAASPSASQSRQASPSASRSASPSYSSRPSPSSSGRSMGSSSMSRGGGGGGGRRR